MMLTLKKYCIFVFLVMPLWLMGCNSSNVDVNSIKTLDAPSFGDSGLSNKSAEIGKEQQNLEIVLTCDSRLKDLEVSKDGGDLYIPIKEVALAGYDLDCSDRSASFSIPTSWFFNSNVVAGEYYFLRFHGHSENGFSSASVLSIKIVEASTGPGDGGGGTGETPTVTLNDLTDSNLSLSEAINFVVNGNCSVGGASVSILIKDNNGGTARSELVTCSTSISVSSQIWNYSGDLSDLGNGDYSIQVSQTQGSLTGTSAVKTFSLDKQPPIATLSAPTTDGALSPFVFTIEFDEALDTLINPLTASDFTVTNGDLAAEPQQDGQNSNKYSLTVTNLNPSSIVKVKLNSMAVQDSAGNSVASVEATKQYTATNPGVTIGTASLDVNSSFVIDIHFSDAVTGFTIDDVTAVNGSLSGFIPVSDKDFQMTVNPTGASGSIISLQIAADKANSSTNQMGNQASNILSVNFDNVQPTGSFATLTPLPTNQSAVPVTLTFSEAVYGLTVSDFNLINGTIANLVTVDPNNPKIYTFDVVYIADGAAAVGLPQLSVADKAGNYSQLVSNLNLEFDRTAPTPLASQLPSFTDEVMLNIDVADGNGEVLNKYKYAIGDSTTLDCTSASYLPAGGQLVSTNITEDTSSYADNSTLKLCLIVSDLAGNWTTVQNAVSYTWLKDASPRQIEFTLSNSSSNEGQAPSFTVQTVGAKTSKDPISFSLAKSGTAVEVSDFNFSASSFTIPSGQTSVSVSVNLVNDPIDEDDETLQMQLDSFSTNSVAGSNNTHTLTILDQDLSPSVSLTTSAFSIGEADTPNTITITASLNTVSGRNVTVPLVFSGSATSATDYTTSASSISIAPGNLSGTVTLTVMNDATMEGNENIILTFGSLVNAVSGAPNSQTISVVDDEIGTATLNRNSPSFPTNVIYPNTASIIYTITNTGNLAASSMNLSLADTGGILSIDAATSTCDDTTTLAVSATCTIAILFKSAGEGATSASLNLNYYNGSTNASLTDTITVTGSALSRAVTPVFGANSLWNYYIQYNQSDYLNMTPTICTGAETGGIGNLGGCLHAGEMRKIQTEETSCVGLKVLDTADNFNWSCGIQAGKAIMYSTSLREDRGLADLIYSTGSISLWRVQKIAVYKNDRKILYSPSQTDWWTNSISTLTASSATIQTYGLANNVYVANSNFNFGGVVINADGIAVVTMPGASISWHTSASGNNINMFGENASNSYRATLAAGSQKFLWIEGKFHGGDISNVNTSSFPIYMYSVNYSRLHRIREQYANFDNNSSGIKLSASNYNLLTQIRASNNRYMGVLIENNSMFNTFYKVIADNNGRGNSTSAHGISFQSSSQNILLDSMSISNTGVGIYINGGSNTLSHINTIANGASGFGTGYGIYSSSTTTINQAVIANNNDVGLYNLDANTKTSQVFLTGSPSLITDPGGGNYFHNILLGSAGSCSATNLNNCLASGVNYKISTFSAAVSDIFNGLLGIIDYLNPLATATVTASLASSSNNFTDFYNSGTTLANVGAGSGLTSLASSRCGDGTNCSEIDWRTKSSGPTFNTSGEGNVANDAWGDGQACPLAVDGDVKIVTDQASRVFLVNAVEIIGDIIGNENGLCESNESCIYSPHFGARQGSKTLSTETCIYQGLTVQNVKMYRYIDKTSYNTFNPRTLASPTGLQGSATSIVHAGDYLAASSNADISHALTRGTVYRNQGKYYYEIYFPGNVQSPNYTETMVGIAVADSSITGVRLGGDNTKLGVGLDLATGTLWTMGVSTTVSSLAIAPGDILSVAVELNTSGPTTEVKIWYAKNGVWTSNTGALSNPASSTGFNYSTVIGGLNVTPAVSFYRTGVTVRANFGQKPFVYTPPAGFTAGWY